MSSSSLCIDGIYRHFEKGVADRLREILAELEKVHAKYSARFTYPAFAENYVIGDM